jgi:tetratricopeptide (TPR) repeat protein
VNELYDVILLGIDAEVPDRRASIGMIAELLGVDEAKIAYVIENNKKAIVKHGILLEEAQNYQHQILRRGGFCNYRPVQISGTKLELAPIEEKSEEIVFSCPACNYREKVAAAADMPVNCPQCGIIPSKYYKVAAIKNEREMVKRRLLGKQQLLEQQAKDLAESQQREARRRKLEEEVRKELGLPKALNSRLRLFGSAACLWVLGIGMGAAGFGLYTQTTPVQGGSLAAAGAGDHKTDQSFSPQQETLRMVNAPSQVPVSFEDQANLMMEAFPQSGWGGINPMASIPPAIAQTLENPAPSANGPAKPARMSGKALLDEIRSDREWELFLAAEAERLAKLKQPAMALQMVAAIRSARLKMTTFGLLAKNYLASKSKPEAENLFKTATDSIAGLPSLAERADNLGWWSRGLWDIGEKAKAQENLEELEKLVSTLSDPAEKAKGLASLASHQAHMGQRKSAESNFRQANALISAIGDPKTKLRTYAHMASCYAQSGDRAIAAAILSKILSQAKSIRDGENPSGLVGEIAIAFADIGEVDYALAALDKLNAAQKEKLLFNVTRELAYTDRPYDAMKGLEKMDAPEYQSRAAALLSLLFRYRPASKTVSANLQEKAITAQAQIANPQAQALARAEMARYLAHAGLAQEADEWAAKAMDSAQNINAGQERDAAFAELAVNYARARQITLADKSVHQINDMDIAKIVERETATINGVFSE